MARQQQKDYKFTPGGAGVGTVKFPGNYDIAEILTILNATSQTFIYNFADPELGAIVTFSKSYDSDFPQSQDGVTTVTLNISTSSMSSTDQLAIYIETEAQSIRPWPFGTDAVERMRVSNPQSLIDADFEYGLQNTKWQSLSMNNDVPSLYELPGSELNITTSGYASLIGQGDITNNTDTTINLSNQSGISTANWELNDYALIVNPYVANPPPTTYITVSAVNSNQRGITVANAQPFSSGDEVIMVQLPATNQTTVSNAITSGDTTTITVFDGSAFLPGQHIFVQTNQTNLWELMTVTNVATNTLTVIRRRLGTNSANLSINLDRGVRIASNIEIAQVVTVDSSTSFSLNRGWMNTTPVRDMIVGSVIQKLNKDPGTSSGANVEIVKLTTVGNTQGNAAVITRGQLGTTAITSAPAGSVIIRLVGIFQAGNSEIPLVGSYIFENNHTANTFISTAQHNNSNTEGLYQVIQADTNYLFWYPRRLTGLQLGYTLNKFDTQIRKAGSFTGSLLPVSTISSNGLNPSTITVTTPYAHGLSPGTPLIVDITSAAGNLAYGEGSFTTLSIPSPTTFTYQTKTGKPVTGSITANIYIRPSVFYVHRPFDGGVLIGSGTPHRGAMAARQSKKYFRYQSGKGLVWSSGTLLSTNFDVTNVSATGTVITGNTISITTEVEHYLQIGANVRLSGVDTSGYNGFYRVGGITNDTTFTVFLNTDLGSATPVLGSQPKINLVNWHGSSVRAGIFDEQNGAFWENNGTNVNVVLRSATFQLTGTLNLEVGSNYVTGDGTCRFAEQLKQYDRIVVRGMSHTVTSIISNNEMTVSPPWRGVRNQTRVKATRVIDKRIPQSQFNLDRVDGTGPSGYILDPTKMQMLLIQYTWYGAGFVDFGLRGPLGNYIMCHRIQNNNVNDEAYMRSGNLPVRYSANNEGPVAKLANAISAGDTLLYVDDDTQFPTATVAFPFYIQVDNEIIKVSGHVKGSNQFTNLTRGSTFTLWQDGASRSFTMGAAASHNMNVAVAMIDCTSSPTLNHWGSAVIMDGGFDQDRGYAFTYARNNMALPTAADQKTSVFLMRLAPSVSNTIIGDVGDRDLINRAQLILENMFVNVTGGRFLVEGILNPTNIDGNTIDWVDLNTEITGNQPSFTQFATAFQFAAGTTGGVVPAAQGQAGGVDRTGLSTSTTSRRYINYAKLGVTPGMTTSGSGVGANISIWELSTTVATVNEATTAVIVHEQGSGFQVGDTITIPGNIWTTSTTSTIYSGTVPTNNVTLTLTAVAAGVEGGERLFGIPVNTTNSGFLDLTKVKQIGTSAIPGTSVYPDGPEVLAINVTAITPTSGAAPTGDFQITFSETQA